MPNILHRLRFRQVRKAIPQERGPLYAAVRDALVNVQQYARTHGGTIELVDVTDAGEVVVRMKGTCKGCPLAGITLKSGVEEQLRVLVPGVSEVTRIG